MSKRVVNIEIAVDADDDTAAELVVLRLLDDHADKFLTWQVTQVAPEFSEEAKAYNPDWLNA